MIKKMLFAALLLLPAIAVADTGDIPLSSNFQENSGRPLDSKLVTASSTTRAAISSTLLYDGMIVYQKDTNHSYQLQGSTYNWVDLGSLGTVSLSSHSVVTNNLCVGKSIQAGGTFITTAAGSLDASALVNPLPAISGGLLTALNPQVLYGQFSSIYAASPEVMNEGPGISLWRQPDSHSTHIGTDAGFNAVSANVFNVCVGEGCQSQFNPTGGFCSCVGDACQGNIQTSNACTSAGYASQYGMTTGNHSNSFGFGSQQTGQATSYSNCFGNYCQFASTDSINMNCMGETCQHSAVHGSSNDDCMGFQCQYNLTSGVLNFCGASNCQASLTTGIEMTCEGQGCQQNATTATGSTCNGQSCQASLTTGVTNDCSAINCQIALTTGTNNSCSGTSCQGALIYGQDNYSGGANSLLGLIHGNGNTAVGANTAYNVGGSTIVTTGNYSNFWGWGAGWSGAGQPWNATAIGFASQVNCSSCIALGGPVGSGNEVNVKISSLTLTQLTSGGTQCLHSVDGYITGTGADCGSGGGGSTAGTITTAAQFSLPYYSLSGSSTTLAAYSGATVSTNTGVTISTLTVTNSTSASVGNNPGTVVLKGPHGNADSACLQFKTTADVSDGAYEACRYADSLKIGRISSTLNDAAMVTLSYDGVTSTTTLTGDVVSLAGSRNLISGAITISSNTVLPGGATFYAGSGQPVFQNITINGTCTGTGCGAAGGGTSGTVNSAAQFSLPYYSLPGSSTSLSAFTGVSLSTNTGITVAPVLANANSMIINSTGTGTPLTVVSQGFVSNGLQNRKGMVTIGDQISSRTFSTEMVLVDSTTDNQGGGGMLELWEDNVNHNDPLLWIHNVANTSNPFMRVDDQAPDMEIVNTSTDNAHGYGKWEPMAIAYQGVDLQINNRAYDNSGFETLAYYHPLTKLDAPPGLYFQTQSLASDSGVLSSSDTSSVNFFTQNNHFVGITGPLNTTTSWQFSLPSTPNNLGQVLYQSDNGRGNNFNVRSMEFTTGGTTGSCLQYTSGGAPVWGAFPTIYAASATASFPYGLSASTGVYTSTVTASAFVLSGTGNPSFLNPPDNAWYQMVGSSDTNVVAGHLAIFSASNTVRDGGAVPSAGSGSSIYAATATASFPFGLTLSTAAFTDKAAPAAVASVDVLYRDSTDHWINYVPGNQNGASYNLLATSASAANITPNHFVSFLSSNGATGDSGVVATLGQGTWLLNQSNLQTGATAYPDFLLVGSSMTIYGPSVLNSTVSILGVASSVFTNVASMTITNPTYISTLTVTQSMNLGGTTPLLANSNLTLGATNMVVLASATAAGITITLPSVSVSTGQVILITKVDQTTFTVTINASGTDVIQGTGTHTMNNYTQNCQLQAIGSGIWIPVGLGCTDTPQWLGTPSTTLLTGALFTSSATVISLFENKSPCYITAYKHLNGSTVTSTFDNGVYSLTGQAIHRLGVTQQTGSSVVQTSSATVPYTLLPPGWYYIALQESGITGLYGGNKGAISQTGMINSLYYTATTMGLPASFTIGSGAAVPTQANVPSVGLICAGALTNGAPF